jgi:hypothetical protein
MSLNTNELKRKLAEIKQGGLPQGKSPEAVIMRKILEQVRTKKSLRRKRGTNPQMDMITEALKNVPSEAKGQVFKTVEKCGLLNKNPKSRSLITQAFLESESGSGDEEDEVVPQGQPLATHTHTPSGVCTHATTLSRTLSRKAKKKKKERQKKKEKISALLAKHSTKEETVITVVPPSTPI